MHYSFLNGIYHKALDMVLERVPQQFLGEDAGKVAHEITDYIYSEINYQYLVPYEYTEEFKEFFTYIVARQCNPIIQPLTCGIESKHNLLIPRITLIGEKYLLCPTCGYVQVPVPESFYKISSSKDDTETIENEDSDAP